MMLTPRAIRQRSWSSTIVVWAVPFWLAGLGAPPVLAQQTTIEALGTPQLQGYPEVQLHLETPKTWGGGTAEVRFLGGPPQEELDAIAQAAELIEQAEAQGAPLGWPAPPEPPRLTSPVRIASFDERDGDDEGLLVVFLIDASASMNQHRSGQWTQDPKVPFGLARSAIKATLRRLGPEDRVMLGRMAGKLEVLVEPTTDREAIHRALDAFQFRSEHSNIIESIVELLQDRLPRLAQPTLPGRRLVLAFSDGRDPGSRKSLGLSASKVGVAIRGQTAPVSLYTVGVGPKQSLHDDLVRIAIEAGSQEQHLESPTPEDIDKALQQALSRANRQLRLTFSAPRYFWRQTRVEATLVVTPSGQSPMTLPLVWDVGHLEPAAARDGQAYLASLQANAARVEAHGVALETRNSKLLWGGIAAGASLIILLAFALSRRARRRSLEQQQMAIDQMRHQIEDRMDAQQEALIEGQQQAQDLAAQQAAAAADAARVPLATLIATEGPLKGRRYALLRNPTVTGRQSDQVDLAFPNDGGDIAISRVHAEFRQADQGWAITALSQGRTSVNQVVLQQGERYPVQPGDTLQLGKTLFQFRGPEPHADQAVIPRVTSAVQGIAT